jgi:hypothetical protein
MGSHVAVRKYSSALSLMPCAITASIITFPTSGIMSEVYIDESAGDKRKWPPVILMTYTSFMLCVILLSRIKGNLEERILGFKVSHRNIIQYLATKARTVTLIYRKPKYTLSINRTAGQYSRLSLTCGL